MSRTHHQSRRGIRNVKSSRVTGRRRSGRILSRRSRKKPRSLTSHPPLPPRRRRRLRPRRHARRPSPPPTVAQPPARHPALRKQNTAPAARLQQQQHSNAHPLGTRPPPTPAQPLQCSTDQAFLCFSRRYAPLLRKGVLKPHFSKHIFQNQHP